MPSQDLIRLLEKQKEEAAHRPDPQAIVRDWQASLKTLFSQLEGWLRPLVKEHLIDVTMTTVTVREDRDRLGEYEAPAMIIKAPGERSVTIQPRARFIVAGEGRVDVGSGPRSAVLICLQSTSIAGGAWWIERRISLGKAGAAVPLTEDSFSDVLRELLS